MTRTDENGEVVVTLDFWRAANDNAYIEDKWKQCQAAAQKLSDARMTVEAHRFWKGDRTA